MKSLLKGGVNNETFGSQQTVSQWICVHRASVGRGLYIYR